jgi:drug/metabolite transporter (DMT)-like permease
MNRISTPVLFLAATLIWGSTWLGITWQLGVVPPEVSVAYRFALAAALLATWCVGTRRSLRFALREHGFLAALGATFFGLNYVSIYWAERYVTSGLVAVVFSTIVFLSPVAMRLVYGTPLTLRTLVAATLGVGGVALLFLPELDAARHGGAAAVGIGFALLGTVFAAMGNVIAVRNHRANLPIFPTTVWGMAYGAFVAAMVATATGATWTFDARAPYVLSLLYLAVFGSIVAFGVYLNLLKRVGAGPSSFVGVATPILALGLSTLVEGYQWTLVASFGVALAVIGNVLALRPARFAVR